jgi:hypothetical protein
MKRQGSSSSLGTGRSRRVPPPTFDLDAVEDERALNAAAAREVSRELDALNFSPPPGSPPKIEVQTQGNWEFATPAPRTPQKTSPENQYAPPPQAQYSPPANQYSPPPQNQYSPPANQNQYSPPAGQPPTNREPSPLIPPAAPFARKATLDNVPSNREPSPLIPPVVPSLRKATLDNAPGHQSTPSWDAPAPAPVPSPVQPTPSQPGHHTTPSWAISPAPPVDRDGTGSPISPRIDSPYRAPFATRSTSSLNTQPPPGARTISAAAFRRPQKTGTGDGMADTSPLAFKKRLPASPYPQARTGSGLREASPLPPPQQPEDDFDYISAYERDSKAFLEDGSPMAADFDYGRLGKVEVVGGPPKSPGYSEGRFATDLGDGIR